MKAAAKRLVPRFALETLARHRLRRDMKRSLGKTRQEVFAEIYNNNLWGGVPGTYSSGSGSRPDIIEPYIQLVRSLIDAKQVRSIVDLGCGDFQVGRRLVSPRVSYVGCDVVPAVVEHDRGAFADANVEFRAMDIVTDPLPDGDLCIIRQVFQHLSNADIAIVLDKARKYQLLLVTDEQVHGDNADANIDIAPYHGTRRLFGQGLRVERAPFFENVQTLLDHSSGSDYGLATGTYLRTVRIQPRLRKV